MLRLALPVAVATAGLLATSALAQPNPPPPYGLDLASTPGTVLPGGPLLLTVAGVAPGTTVEFGRGTDLGAPFCPAAIAPACLDLTNPTLQGSAVANAAGEATLPLVVPPGAPLGASVTFQAVADPGTGFAASNPVTIVLGTSCGNGVLDAGESCDDGNAIDYDGCSATCDTDIDITGTATLDVDLLVDVFGMPTNDSCSTTVSFSLSADPTTDSIGYLGSGTCSFPLLRLIGIGTQPFTFEGELFDVSNLGSLDAAGLTTFPYVEAFDPNSPALDVQFTETGILNGFPYSITVDLQTPL